MNLLKETMDKLTYSDKHESDVRFVRCIQTKASYRDPDVESWISWEEFKELANFEYDDGFGGHEIDLNLMVVGQDWWLERHEYDGSEWWEFKTMPLRPTLKAEAPTEQYLRDK